MQLTRAVLFCFFIGLSGCATTSVTPTPMSASIVNNGKMAIFNSDSQVNKPFAVVGTIHHLDPGKWQHVDLADITPLLAEKALSLNADAVIIDSQSTVISGIFSRGIEVRARAIKYK